VRLAALVVATVLLAACGAGHETTTTATTPTDSREKGDDEGRLPGTPYAFDFTTGTHGWVATLQPSAYASTLADYRALPASLSSSSALYVYLKGGGLVFFKRRITGLTASAWYRASFSAQIATNVGYDCYSFGGPPSRHYVYLGAYTAEPKTLTMGSREGDENLLHVGSLVASHDCTTQQWELETLASFPNSVRVQADGDGSLWLVFAAIVTLENLGEFYLTRFAAGLEGPLNPDS
jgi:hypothetical protein